MFCSIYHHCPLARQSDVDDVHNYTTRFNEIVEGEVYWYDLICLSLCPFLLSVLGQNYVYSGFRCVSLYILDPFRLLLFCPSADKIVSALYLPQCFPGLLYICTFCQPISKGVSRVKFLLKNPKFDFSLISLHYDLIMLWPSGYQVI